MVIPSVVRPSLAANKTCYLEVQAMTSSFVDGSRDPIGSDSLDQLQWSGSAGPSGEIQTPELEVLVLS